MIQIILPDPWEREIEPMVNPLIKRVATKLNVDNHHDHDHDDACEVKQSIFARFECE